MIDWQRINELTEELGEEDVFEILDLFLCEAGDVVDILATAPRGPGLAEQMHFLKGSALNLGFDTLSRLCTNGEKLAEAGQADLVPIPEILSVFKASKAAMRAHFIQDQVSGNAGTSGSKSVGFSETRSLGRGAV